MNNKAHRASVNRSMRGMRNESVIIKHKAKFVSAFKDTLAHMKPLERHSWRVKVARENVGDRLSKQVTVFIERYETYSLKKRHLSQEAFSVSGYLRAYCRKDKGYTREIISEINDWYSEHGNERISRMKKMHAIVGNSPRIILRTE